MSIWDSIADTAKSLGGVGFEQSIRLEPTQVAGFNQFYDDVNGAGIPVTNSFTGHTRTENVLRVVLHKPVPWDNDCR